MFFILRLFFFPNYLNEAAGEGAKEDYVSSELIMRAASVSARVHQLRRDTAEFLLQNAVIPHLLRLYSEQKQAERALTAVQHCSITVLPLSEVWRLIKKVICSAKLP